MTDDWATTMDAAKAMAEENGLEFYELRNAWGNAKVAEDADFYEGQGVTSSDMNHMLYGAVKHDTTELARFAAKLGADKAERARIVNNIAAMSGQAPELVLQQLREFFAPVSS